MTLKNKKIIFMLASFQLGGAERQALLLGEYLQNNKGANVEFWAGGTFGPVIQWCLKKKIKYRSIEFYGKGSLEKLSVELQVKKVDVLIPYCTLPNVVCGLIWKKANVKSCIWNQEDAGIISMPGIMPIALRQIRIFISNSYAGANYLSTVWDVNKESINVIPNGIKLDFPVKSRNDWRVELGINCNSFVAIMVANLQAFKDHYSLIRAWRRVVDLSTKKEAPILVLAGRKDNTYDNIKNLVNSLKLESHVILPGEVEDVSGILYASDLCVYSSNNEGCPNGILEAMMANLPVVATKCEGIGEAVGYENDIFLAKPRDEKKFSDLILLFMNNSMLCKAVGKKNKKRVEQFFKIENLWVDTADIIEKSLKENFSKNVNNAIFDKDIIDEIIKGDLIERNAYYILSEKIEKLKEAYVVYGTGKFSSNLLKTLKKMNLPLPKYIMDLDPKDNLFEGINLVNVRFSFDNHPVLLASENFKEIMKNKIFKYHKRANELRFI
jgi:glycosyltransferase involved in cell wall biosynthesis